ncbi:hypothetical protein O181_064565 [Austropuccinia psidii MF-1]|uniref:Uncharacterized protein n=1 Tax=Austropuccinia psidii MF-1 TaxID=1389203 RepID=A0A9Q3EKQ5_9BASI|nr:hypothetical protein [Austropuccinia psidii MF-1]
MLRRPPYQESLDTRKEIQKHVNECLDMDTIRKIRHNESVEVTALIQITWNDGKARLRQDSRALNNYTKVDRYPIPRMPHALGKIGKSQIHYQDGFYERVSPE